MYALKINDKYLNRERIKIQYAFYATLILMQRHNF